MTRLPQLWVATAVLLLCASSASAGRLLSTWSSWSGGPFTLTEISAQTAQQGKVLGTANGIIEFFAGNPGIDYGRSRAYFAVITGQNTTTATPAPVTGALAGWDLSNPNSATLFTKIPLPQSYIMSILHDRLTDSLYVVTAAFSSAERNLKDTAADPVTVGAIDSKGTYTNITIFPDNTIPFAGDIGGTPSVFDAKRRLLIYASATMPNQAPALTTYNLLTKQFKVFPLPQYRIISMAMDPASDKIYCILQPKTTPPSNSSFATLNPLTGAFSIIYTWPTSQFAFAVGGMSALDAASNRYYSVMGGGFGPPVALVSIDTTSGKIVSSPLFGTQQPQSVFYL